MIRSRPYAGAVDLQRMLRLTADCFSSTDVRVGDVAWATREHTHRELSLYVRLWERAGDLVGFASSEPSGWLEPVLLHPDHRTPELYQEVLDDFEGSCTAAMAFGDPEVRLRVQVGATDEVLREVLVGRGFEREDWSLDIHRLSTHSAAQPSPPPGYRLDHVTEQNRAGRVEAHRAAFAPSALTLPMLTRLSRLPAYSESLDRVVIGAKGTVVAACTGWLDARNQAGLLEPVGTVPEHRRRGLGRAVCLDAVRCLREAGAREIQVLGVTGSGGAALYRSMGFERVGQLEIYGRAGPAKATTEA